MIGYAAVLVASRWGSFLHQINRLCHRQRQNVVYDVLCYVLDVFLMDCD